MKHWDGRILKITCQRCGHIYQVELKKPRKCINCDAEGWRCPHCGLRFKPTEWCKKCKRAICPRCHSCECVAPRRVIPRRVGEHEMVILKCFDCGSQTPIKLNQPIKCPECGFDKWKCWNCGHEQPYKVLCHSCGWFICEICGSCKHKRHRLVGVEASEP